MAVVGTGLSVGSRTVRVLQVRKGKAGAWEVTRALVSHLAQDEPTDAQRVAEARSALQTAGVKGKALAGLSGKDLIVRYTQVPPVPDWRLEMLMNFEIQEVSEQSGGDVSAAYAQLEVDDTTTGDNVVLVALAKNGYLNPRLAAMNAAGLSAQGGCPRSVAAFWAYKENGHLRFDETVAIMNIGHENTDVAIARSGRLLFARNVTGGSSVFTDVLKQNMRVNFATAEKMKRSKGNLTPRGQANYKDSAEEKIANALISAAGHLVSAFNSSVMFAKAQTKVPDCAPDRLVIMGGGALLRGLPDYLEANLGIPVEVFDPFESVDLSALPAEQAEALRLDQGGMAVTLGLAQIAADPGALHVDILPESDRKKRRFMEETLFTIISGAVIAVALIVAFSMSGAAEATAITELNKLTEIQKQHSNNESEFAKALNTVIDLNHENVKLRRLVSMGPAVQRINTVVQTALNTDPPFEEIFIEKFTASMRNHTVEDKATGNKDVIEQPALEYTAQIEQVGGRDIATAYGDFQAQLKSLVSAKGYLEYEEIGRLEKGTFKFRIIETRFPEAPAAAAGETAGEGN